MVKIRLSRTGRKKLPTYRIVVADSHARRDGRFIEILGRYSPIRQKELVIDKDRYEYWVKQGAQPTQTVKRLVTKGVEKAPSQK